MEKIRDIILTVLFLCMLGLTAVQTEIWNRCGEFISVCMPSNDSKAADEDTQDSEKRLELSDAGTMLLESLACKDSLVELGGAVLKQTNTRSYYNNTVGINITREGYNVGRYSSTSTDYEVEQMIGFKEYLDAKGIRLLYVSEPSKYIDDSFYQKEFGGESYLNRNTDLFLSRIGQAGIEYIDLRKNIVEEGLDPLSLFYRTDHHWTVPASKWAAGIIAERLNEDYGYQIDMGLYEDSQFHMEFYEEAWLGEQGKKVAQSYIGLDDYTMMEPLYDTSYTITGGAEPKEGDFGLFINKDVYDSEAEPYEASSWHYSYRSYEGTTFITILPPLEKFWCWEIPMNPLCCRF